MKPTQTIEEKILSDEEAFFIGSVLNKYNKDGKIVVGRYILEAIRKSYLVHKSALSQMREATIDECMKKIKNLPECQEEHYDGECCWENHKKDYILKVLSG